MSQSLEDHALAALGGRVVGHSELLPPARSWRYMLRQRWARWTGATAPVHEHADQVRMIRMMSGITVMQGLIKVGRCVRR